ncbi:hypothetical protein CNR22_01915 [Sphingobacteriaceae bacterium]|nr:hypothetical protein CNR22_01915 [Sphingobacteriaceae bacterium]
MLKVAGSYGFFSIAITVLIITQLNLKLFFGDLEKYREDIFSLSVIWLIGKGIRLLLVGTTLYYTVKTYLLRDYLRFTKSSADDL